MGAFYCIFITGLREGLHMFFDRLFGKKADDKETDDDMNETGRRIKQIKEQLLNLAKNEIRISYSETELPISPAESKIGGKPDLPEGFVWPEFEGKGYLDDETATRPLSFLVQINLKDIALFDKENLLPHTGVLSFFYDLVTMTWGFEPSDKGSARVFYFSDESALSPRDFPKNLSTDAILPELKIGFEPHISLPDFDSCINADLDFDCDEYDEICSELGYEYDGLGDVTKLLGYADVIQSPMEEECERVTRGFRCGNPEDYAKTPAEEKSDIKRKAGEWVLLFQMGTVTKGNYELMFGDCGHIYFWIRKADLAARNFDNVWLILQCS